MQHHIHHGQPVGILNMFHTEESLVFVSMKFLFRQIENVVAFAHIMIGRNQKSAGPGRRVLNHFADPGLHEFNHYIDQHPWGKILPGARFFLIGVFLQQPFVQITHPFLPGRIPVQVIDTGDQCAQGFGFFDK